MKQKVYDVYRNCNGMSEQRFSGTEEECRQWIANRGDTGRAYYSMENPRLVEEVGTIINIQIKDIHGNVLFELSRVDNTFKETLEEAVRQGVCLRYANLTEVDLSHADLRKARLSDAYIRYTNLRYANLRGANLSNALFWGADLTGADVSYVNLTRSIMHRTKLFETILYCTRLDGANLRLINLSNADLRSSDLRYATIDASDFSLVNFDGAKFDDTIFFRCDMKGAVNIPTEGSRILIDYNKDDE
jgi:uncharacterized protein YjbI with pentapeptide repeats